MKNCIVILSRSDFRTIIELKTNLDSLYANYVNKFPCDVLIFHEEDFPSAFKDYLTSFEYNGLQFIEVELKRPDFLSKSSLNFKDKTQFGLSYRNMCRFFFKEFYKYLRGYDWFFRLDTDSKLLDDINFDLFEYLETNNKVYGYVAELREHAGVISRIDEFLQKFMEKYSLKGKFLDYLKDHNGLYNGRMIYNNFEIAKLEIFENDGVKSFMDEVDKTGYIYEYRWGDAPLRTIMLSLFFNRDQIYMFDNVGYHHQEFRVSKGIIDCKQISPVWVRNNDFIGRSSIPIDYKKN